MDNQQSIVTYKNHDPQSTKEVRERVEEIQAIMTSIMKVDVHYGVIPHTNKPTLYKAGAEVLLTAFRISVQPEIVDLSSEDEIRYRVIANGVHMLTQTLIGSGVGECSTNEEKYKWRAAVSDAEFEATKETRKRIGYKRDYTVNQVRTNPADLANTVLKMAKKRAQVDLCLTALAASDIFSQDAAPAGGATDISGYEEHPKSQSSPPKRSGNSSGMASEKQVNMMKVRCRSANINEVDLLAAFEVTAIEQIPFGKVNDVLTWILEQTNN